MLDIIVEEYKSYSQMTISGEVDAASSIHLDEELSKMLKATPPKILVNCEKLEYISSAGLGVFMSHLQELKTRNINMVLYGMEEKVENVFTILGLDQLITIVKSKELALNAS
jgi:anti-sigma B factor antagonist